MRQQLTGVLTILSISLLCGNVLQAQSQLALSSGTSAGGSAVSLDLTLISTAGNEPAALQWTFNYPAAAVSSFDVTEGPTLTAVSKTLSCANSSSAFTCVATGLNSDVISDGVVAKVSITLVGSSANIGISALAASAPDGGEIPVTATGGTASGVLASSLLSAISCNPSSLAPGAVAACTVTLSSPTASAATVALASTGSMTVPSSVSIAANTASATFNATAGSFTTDQSSDVTATWNGLAITTTISLVALPAPASLQCATTTLLQSSSTTCTIALTKAAPAGGSSVTLANSLTSALTVPASVNVAAGSSTATFTATAAAVTSDQTPTITATLNSSSKTITLTVTATPITISSLQCAPTTMAALSSTTCTVTLSRSASAATIVALTNSISSALTIPASVSVAAGSSSATFTATAAAVTSNQTPSVTANLNGSGKSLTLTVTASAVVTVSALSCDKTTLLPSTTTACTVVLSAPAPGAGAVVSLSVNPADMLNAPASVTVAASATTATFTLATTAFQNAQTGSVTASLNSGSASAAISLILSSTVPTSLSCALSTLTPNTSTRCTVRLNVTAPAGGVQVALTSTVPTVLAVPVSITVPEGAATQTFTASAGTISTGQNATIRAQVSQTVVSFSIALSLTTSSLSTLTCSPLSLPPGQVGTCTVTLTAAAATASTVTLRTTNTGLTLPGSVTIASGSSSATFSFSLAPSMTGWAIISANLGTVTKSVTITAVSNRSSEAATSSVLRLRCEQRQIAAGGRTVCQVFYDPSESPAEIGIAVSTTSDWLKVPSSLRGRAGRNSVRFEVAADEYGPLESVTIGARSGSAYAEESVLVVPAGSLHLRTPRALSATPGSTVRFTATAADDQGLPVSLAVAGKPASSVFDPTSGSFEWTPSNEDIGSTEVLVTATNSLSQTTTRIVRLEVAPARPVLSRLRNGAGSGALAACSPGAIGTLLGSFLTGGSSAETPRVLVNGESVSVLRSSEVQVDFLCPVLQPETPLGISVAIGDQISNELRSKMQRTSPGLLSVDGSGAGQGVATHARGLAALARFDRDAMPATTGEEITLLATGINCGEISGSSMPLLYFGHKLQPVTLLRPSTYPGVCELHTVVPENVTGNDVAVILEVVNEDGIPVRSNAIVVSIE